MFRNYSVPVHSSSSRRNSATYGSIIPQAEPEYLNLLIFSSEAFNHPICSSYALVHSPVIQKSRNGCQFDPYLKRVNDVVICLLGGGILILHGFSTAFQLYLKNNAVGTPCLGTALTIGINSR